MLVRDGKVQYSEEGKPEKTEIHHSIEAMRLYKLLIRVPNKIS